MKEKEPLKRRSSKTLSKITLGLYSLAAGGAALTVGGHTIYQLWTRGDPTFSLYAVLAHTLTVLGLTGLLLSIIYFRKAFTGNGKR